MGINNASTIVGKSITTITWGTFSVSIIPGIAEIINLNTNSIDINFSPNTVGTRFRCVFWVDFSFDAWGKNAAIFDQGVSSITGFAVTSVVPCGTKVIDINTFSILENLSCVTNNIVLINSWSFRFFAIRLIDPDAPVLVVQPISMFALSAPSMSRPVLAVVIKKSWVLVWVATILPSL